MIRTLVRKLESAQALDPVVGAVSGVASTLTGPRPVKNLLSGTWLGHRLHPLLTDVPIGAWVSALVLDIGGDEGKAADRLVALGVVAALPTAASGASDLAEADPRQKRVGLVHAAANTVALVLQVASLVSRSRGNRRRGRALSTAAVGAVAAGGYLGGHLSYVLGVGVDHPTGALGPDWQTACGLDVLEEGVPYGVSVGGVDIVLVRTGERVRALAATCTHAGGPLSEGTVDDGCVICPWHGSRFRLDDGSVVRAPAVTPAPVCPIRVVDGRVEVRGGG